MDGARLANAIARLGCRPKPRPAPGRPASIRAVRSAPPRTARWPRRRVVFFDRELARGFAEHASAPATFSPSSAFVSAPARGLSDRRAVRSPTPAHATARPDRLAAGGCYDLAALPGILRREQGRAFLIFLTHAVRGQRGLSPSARRMIDGLVADGFASFAGRPRAARPSGCVAAFDIRRRGCRRVSSRRPDGMRGSASPGQGRTKARAGGRRDRA